MSSVVHRKLAQHSAAEQLNRASTVLCNAIGTPPGRHSRRRAAAGDAAWNLLLAELPLNPSPDALARWRGRVDAVAARARYSDAQLYAQQQPENNSAGKLFFLLEQDRVETLAAREFPGMRINLAALQAEKWTRARPDGVVHGVGTGWLETFALMARLPLDAPLPQAARQVLAAHWRSWIEPHTAMQLTTLATLVEDQEKFGRQALRVLQAVLAAQENVPIPLLDQQPNDSDELSADLSALHSIGAAAASKPPAAADQFDSAVQNANSDAADPGSQALDAASDYRVYTTAFDTTCRAAELRDAAALQRGRDLLDQRIASSSTGTRRSAHRLQRHLLALQLRSWQFDREEGVLDAARLTRVVTHPLEPLAYKQETQIEFPDTVVGLLVDNSGSMRGEPIAKAAMCAEVLGRALERCGVKTEILGFTTRNWQGGRARRQWAAQGKPPHPGRITELQHVIYKSADEPWRRVRLQLGLMLDEQLLKENVDGEALLWAVDRLLRRTERRRILIVISDGAPLDEATAAANGPDYLGRHLHAVIRRTERSNTVQLIAIGIGHDVTAYYRQAITLSGIDRLGDAIVEQFIGLVDPRAQARRRK